MMLTSKKYSTLLKNTSLVLSNSSFKKILNYEEDIIKRKANTFINSVDSNFKPTNFREFYSYLYSELISGYRNEYVYKNEIINKILLGKYSLNTATVLNEFKIGSSIADLVMLNGTSIVYEIKTEYDSPERLLNQIIDYRKSFLNVVIVAHHSDLKKYLNFLEENELQNVGLIVFTKSRTLREIKSPIEDSSYLSIEYMFKCLRKNEYLSLIKEHFGFVPEVPNTKIFRVCLSLSLEIEECIFHNLMFKYLKKRTIKQKKDISTNKIPNFMKHVSLSLNFNKDEVARVNSFLNQKI